MEYLHAMQKPTWERIAEGAVQVSWESSMDRTVHLRVMGLDQCIREDPFPGWEENVPACHTLTIFFDPTIFEDTIQSLLLRYSDSTNYLIYKGRHVHIPVCYDPEFAPDLPEASSLLGLSPDAIIDLHKAATYQVFMLGFLPGFPYMGMLSEQLVLPRKAIPSVSVAAGSVAITGRQTGIYPVEAPGGWYVIGRTPLPLFRGEQPLLQPGDEVEFTAIDRTAFEILLKEPALWQFM